MCHQSTLLETGACYSIFGTQDLHNALNSRTNVKPLLANWSKKKLPIEPDFMKPGPRVLLLPGIDRPPPEPNISNYTMTHW